MKHDGVRVIFTGITVGPAGRHRASQVPAGGFSQISIQRHRTVALTVEGFGSLNTG